jgi:hypothetical protein
MEDTFPDPGSLTDLELKADAGANADRRVGARTSPAGMSRAA